MAADGRRPTLAAVMVAALAACACGTSSEPPDDYVPSGDPTLAVGFLNNQSFVPLDEGSACPVIYGLQGGTWSMPTLRTRGIAAVATIECDFVTDAGEHVGGVETVQRFVKTPDGWVERQQLPIPVNHAPPREADPIDDLWGQFATFSCRVTDDQARSAEQSVHVKLAQ